MLSWIKYLQPENQNKGTNYNLLIFFKCYILFFIITNNNSHSFRVKEN